MDNKQDISTRTDSRRKFLKKASAGVVITALPAQSVWGACTVSGALSGNASRINNDCQTIPALSNGRSGGSWKDPSNGHKIAAMFSCIGTVKSTYGETSSQYQNARVQAFTAINNVIDGPEINLNKLGTDRLDLRQALNGGGYTKHLAAAYLNFHFGFYNQSFPMASGDINTAQQLVEHLYALIVSGNFSNFTNFEMGYGSGTSSYIINV
jgi:hypothetical protein